MNVFVELHQFHEIVFKVFEFFPVTPYNPLLRTDHTLQLVNSLIIVLDSTIELHSMSLRLNLLVDSLIFKSFLISNLFDHLSKLLVFIENFLERALRLAIRIVLLNAAPGIFGIDDSPVEL